jgi:Rrf2 family protein
MAGGTNTQFAVAVHVLTYLAGVPEGDAISSEELSRSVNVNPVHVRRVLGPLREAGLVASRPGVHGGWELAADASAITLGQVWRILHGVDPVLGVHRPNPDCPVGRSVQESLVALDRVVVDGLVRELDRHTVHDLVVGDAASLVR